MSDGKKDYWDTVFVTKTDQQKSWFEEYPHASVQMIKDLNMAKDASILDIGAGDSRLVDVLLKQGYTDLTVLDISQAAIDHSVKRLGDNASKVKWIVADVLDFKAPRQYNCVHDRAVFHFMTDHSERNLYIQTVRDTLVSGGNYILAGFSGNGYGRCSGLPVARYTENDLEVLLNPRFQKIECFETDHLTPQGETQHFIYCSFFKKE